MKPTPQEEERAKTVIAGDSTETWEQNRDIAQALCDYRIETEERVLREVKEAVNNAKIAKENYEVFEAMQEALGTDAASWSRGFFEKENLALEAIDTYAKSLRTSRGE